MSVRTINYISNILLTIVNFTVNFYLASVIGLESYGNYVVQLSVTSLSVSLIYKFYKFDNKEKTRADCEATLHKTGPSEYGYLVHFDTHSSFECSYVYVLDRYI